MARPEPAAPNQRAGAGGFVTDDAHADSPAPARDLGERLTARIRAEGPISVATYMSEALYDLRAGYYATKDPIGAGADFITAPEISPMFGEILGLWAVQAWIDMGEPAPLTLIELGPGRGAMLSDALRAARLRPAFLNAARAVLVEASPALQNVQAQTLAEAGVSVSWTRRLETAQAGPTVLLANEFLDCLPVRQFVKLEGAWRERLVGLHPDGLDRFAFVFAPLPATPADVALLPASLREAADGAIVEIRPGVEALLDALAARFHRNPGKAVFIDYGPACSEIGDTVQAVQAHQKADPLQAPGTRDLTARVDFQSLAESAKARGFEVTGPTPQGEWLLAHGLEQRAAALAAANPNARARLAAQLHRLADPDEMGALFKVLTIASAAEPAL